MFEKLRKYGVIPVVAVDTPEDGLRLCDALLHGGLPVAEITFRTAAAEEAIRQASKRFPEMLLGAGTVLNVGDLARAIDAGAQFAVAPGCNPEVVRAAVAQGLPFAPGVCTPSDIEAACSAGVRTLKFFPAEAAGGITMLKALIGPYGHLGISFCPTGGISEKNMVDYLNIKEVACVGGTWIAKKEMMRDGEWHKIAETARKAVETAATRVTAAL